MTESRKDAGLGRAVWKWEHLQQFPVPLPSPPVLLQLTLRPGLGLPCVCMCARVCAGCSAESWAWYSGTQNGALPAREANSSR